MNNFLIVIPAYNCERFIEKCLDSALSQDYQNFQVVVIDDGSTDGTWDILKDWPYKQKLNLIHNDKRAGSALENTIKGINAFEGDIIVTVDADDYLYDKSVLSYLDSIYTEDVWLTYGQNKSLSGKLDKISQSLSNVRTWKYEELRNISVKPSEYRKYGLWHTSHLRTFRRWLFEKIRNEDLRNADGEYFKTCCDVAVMYPMIEMAGEKHIRFVDKILYVYNDLTNNYGNRADENLKNIELIQNRNEYEEITGNGS